MGQAKLRGSYEQRKEDAINKKREEDVRLKAVQLNKEASLTSKQKIQRPWMRTSLSMFVGLAAYGQYGSRKEKR